MLHQNQKRLRLYACLFTLLISLPTYATWSIIAVDRNTGEIGIVGASCTFDVQGIASIVPGKGAIVVQAGSNYFARMKGVEHMRANATTESILTAMRNKEFNPERQQYGVILLNDTKAPLVYSGRHIKDWNGSKIGDNFAVLGNILVDEKVIENAYQAFNNSQGTPFAERLMLALKAGEISGGDKRCGQQYARSAFISVYNPKDAAILKLSVHGIEKGGKPAVSLLDEQLRSWKINQSKNTQTEHQNSIRSFNNKQIASSKIDAFIEQQMDSLNIPGLSIAIVNNDKTVYHRALGVKNIETQEKVDGATFFDAASMSKTVFSFFIMKMVDDGLLDLDVPLYTYMEYPDIAHDDRYKLITARMVLSHTSGFPNWRFIDQKGNYNPDNKLSIQFRPGTKFQYSGEGYEYLALVIAHLKGVTKNELQDILKNEIFKPLSMHNSSFVWNTYLEKHRVDGHFRGVRNNGYSSNAKDPNFKASASLQTESKEFANFLIALLNSRIISQKGYKELLKIQSTSHATKKSKKRNYGLGVVIEESDNGTTYSHGGDNLSNTALYLFNQEQKVGYVFFTNSENKDIFNKNLLEFLLTK